MLELSATEDCGGRRHQQVQKGLWMLGNNERKSEGRAHVPEWETKR